MIVNQARVAAALPGYDLGAELGAGSYGLVFAAQHRRLGRQVAVKVLAAGEGDADAGFAAEARLLAGFDHPHIVRVHDYIEDSGLHLIVMELLDGGTLAQRRADLTPEGACAAGLVVADALAYAHGQGVLHRDVKPDNVLFDTAGVLKVVDFGIAKIVERSAATASAVVGTMRYMAPEQITCGRLGPATDLYSLGVVVYELLAGVPPFGPDLPVAALMHHHLHSQPIPLAGVPAAVAEVVFRALAKEPSQRHPSAQAFALDLAEAAVRGYGVGWVDRSGIGLRLGDEVRRAAERPLVRLPAPWPPGAADAALPASRQNNTASFRLSIEDRSVTVGYRMDVSAVPGAPTAHVYGQGHGHGQNPVKLKAGTPAADAQADAGGRAVAGARRDSTAAGGAGVHGRRANVAVDRGPPGGRNRRPDARPPRRRRRAVRRRVVLPVATALALTLMLSLLLIPRGMESGAAAPLGPDLNAISRRLAGEALRVHAAGQPASARGLAIAAYRVAPTRQARLSLLATLDHPASATFVGHTDWVSEATFSPDGATLATAGGDRVVRLWDVGDRGSVGEPLATLTGHTGWVFDVAFSPDGATLATVSADGSLRLWDAGERGSVGEPLATFTGHTGHTGHIGAIGDVLFSPDGAVLATAGDDGSVRLWDAGERGSVGEPLATFTGHTGWVLEVAFSPDGAVLATAGDDGSVRLWDAGVRGGAGEPLATFTGHTDWVVDVAFSPDGATLATAGGDRTARLWDAAGRGSVGEPLATFAGHTGSVYEVAFSPDGAVLATAGDDGSVRLWDAGGRGSVGEPLATLTGHTGSIREAGFSPDGTLVATAGGDRVARLWDLDPQRLIERACADPANRITAAAWGEYVPELPYDPPCD